MSGGGKILEKKLVTLPESGKQCVRYWLVTGESYDELIVYAEPAEEEPGLGETIWWGGDRQILWGPNDSKRLVKIGYSHEPHSEAKP